MGKCDNCNCYAETKNYAIQDDMGTRYRNLCEDCAAKLAAGENTTGSKEDELKIDETQNKATASKVYKIISVVIAICGFVGGIVLGSEYPIKVIEYEYPSIMSGDTTITEKFNAPFMAYAWIGTLILFLGFWAVYRILKNQETIIDELKNLTNK